jgi:methyl-coenzyme M reductase subunit D
MDIEIFPHRLLNAETAEKLLNDLEEVESVKRMVVHGPRLPPLEEGHPDRRTIIITGEEVELQVKPGRILLEIEGEETIDEVKRICEDHIPFGFNVHVGIFIRKEKTVTDKLKYGEDLEKIPREIVGLTDQSAKLSDRAKIIKRKEKQ